MPAAGRIADIGSGHGCFPPSPTIEGSSDVFINSRKALRKGDAVLPHLCSNCPPHPRSVSAGSATVNINGKPAARKSDAINCGGSVSTGSGDVFIGDSSYGSGTGKVKPTARFVLSQIPGSTSHGYYKEPYKLYHNGGLVQEGLTDEKGVIEYEPDEHKGEYEIEALGHRWKLTVQAFAPADTDEGVNQRLAALSYHSSKDTVINSDGRIKETDKNDLAWFQATRGESIKDDITERVRNLLRAILP